MNPSTKNTMLILLSSSMLVFALIGCSAAHSATKEHLDWDIQDYILVFEEGTGWKGAGGEETQSRIYSAPGATIENWTITLNVIELPIAITFMSKTRWNPESIMNAKKDRLLKHGCTDPWTVIQLDSTSLIYERREVNCPGYLHQYEIGRIVMGKGYSWWLLYRIRDVELSEDDKRELIANLSKATVVK